MIIYIFSGLLGVINMICWGLYGDLLVEKFKISKVFRSIFLGLFYSIFLFFVNPNLPPLIVVLAVIALERITTEIYKALIRVEKQDKYKIPSDLGIKFIGNNLKRFIGAVIILVLLFSVYKIEIPNNYILLILIMGALGAVGGALKDAPFEGFDFLKFFRTPIVTVVAGIILWELYPFISGKFFLLAIGGGERIISEFYKKILKGRVPGKFSQKEFNIKWKQKRKYLLIIYSLDILGILALVFYF